MRPPPTTPSIRCVLAACLCAALPLVASGNVLAPQAEQVAALETVEGQPAAGARAEVSAQALAEALAAVEQRLLSHPEAAEALILFARITRLQQLLAPTVMRPGQAVPAAAAADAAAPLALAHVRLARAQTLQPVLATM